MLISGLNSYLYTGIISIAEMGIKLWSLDHIRFVDYGVRLARPGPRGNEIRSLQVWSANVPNLGTCLTPEVASADLLRNDELINAP